MRRLYSENNPNSMFIRAEVPSKQGVVLEVDPKSELLASMSAHYSAVDMLGHKAEAYGLMHDVPRVVVRFKTSATDDKTLSAAMPRDGQYHLRLGDTVVVYADEFAEKPDYTKPPKSAQARPFAVVDEDLRLDWSHPHKETSHLPDPTDPHMSYFEEVSGSRFSKKISEEIPKSPKHLENVNPDPLTEEMQAKIRALSTDALEGIVERNLPISLAGMQVLDEQGRVRYECACQPGMGFR